MKRALSALAFLVAIGCGKEGVPAARVAAEPTATPVVATPEPTDTPTATPTATPEPAPSPTPSATPSATPAAWSRVDEGDFSFELPDDAEEKKAQGIDSQIGRFESETLYVSYDYGWYSGDPADEDAPEYRDQWKRIDGEFAHVSYWKRDGEPRDDSPGSQFLYQAGVYFSEVGEDRDGPQTTKLRLNVSSADGWDDAERIIESIRFDG